MKYEPDKDLERLIQDELQKLPDFIAPATLISRVNARIEGGASVPWWRQSWLGWPLAAQLASGAVLVVFAVFCAMNLLGLELAAYDLQLRQWLGLASDVWQRVANGVNAFAVLTRVIWEHFLVWFVILFGLMIAATAAIGSGLWRLALHGNHSE